MTEHNDRALTRRTFVQSAAAAALCSPSTLLAGSTRRMDDQPLYGISLAQWSLHRALRAGKLDALDFAKTAREDFGIEAVEYVNSFFKDKARDEKYLAQFKQRAADHGVKSLLIMVDGEGALGDADDDKRTKAIQNHHQWVEAAKFLGCHSIRVNAQSSGSYEEQMKLAADGLRRLTEFGASHDINVIVENHGGLSSNGAWLTSVMKMVDHPRCGTLPDFGNFCTDWKRRDEPDAWYDRYKGVEEMMSFAKAVSAKSHQFDANGDEVNTDYRRMMRIVLDAGYRGYVGVEWEGDAPGEAEGIRLTKALLVKVRDELTAEGKYDK
jgi:L-ribulose-5-phosphate 3-epimerase